MDHLSRLRKNVQPLTSPSSGVSQSKFLSPCRRTGLKRTPPNMFAVKFNNCDTKNKVPNLEHVHSPSDLPTFTSSEDVNKALPTSIIGSSCETNCNTILNTANKETPICPSDEFDEIAHSQNACGENIIAENKKATDIGNFSRAFSNEVQNANESSEDQNSSISRRCDSPDVLPVKTRADKYRNCASPDVMQLKSSADKSSELLSNLPIFPNGLEYLPDKTSENLNDSSEISDKCLKIIDNSEKSNNNSDKKNNVSTNEKYFKPSSPNLPDSKLSLCETSNTSYFNCAESTMQSSVTVTTPIEGTSEHVNKSFALDTTETPTLGIGQSINIQTVQNAQIIHKSKAKNVKRFKTPLKQGFVSKKIKIETTDMLSDVEQRIAAKEKKIAEMKAIIANSLKHDINHIESLIVKWRTGGQEALNQLLSEVKARTSDEYNMTKLLLDLNIPHELLKYNATDQDFAL